MNDYFGEMYNNKTKFYLCIVFTTQQMSILINIPWI